MDLKIDLETAPYGNIEDVEVKVPGNYSKPETIAKYIEENRESEYRKGALHGISGQIVSIAWQRQAKPIRAITRDHSLSETELLEQFFAEITDYGKIQYPRFKWIGHNLLNFDLRFLKQRCWITGVRPPVHIPADARHGEWAFDTMLEWAGFRGYVSQDALYRALGGQPYEDDGMDGSMVYDAWLAGEYDKIKAYNIRDIEKLAHNYARLTQ